MKKETGQELKEEMLTGVNGGTDSEPAGGGCYTAMFQSAAPQVNAVPVTASTFCPGSYTAMFQSTALQFNGALSGESEGDPVPGMFEFTAPKAGE